MKRKVGIIGKFGTFGIWCDGQTIKTKNLAMLLEEAGIAPITKVDTCYFQKNKIKLMLDTLWCILTCKDIFLMVSVNGMNFYLPFLHYVNKVMRRNIYHYVIGSELLEMVEENPKLVKYLNSLTVNWFEYETGTKYLKSRGVNNASTLPNFKMVVPVEVSYLYQHVSGKFQFCTFSRVMEEKGITEAIQAIRLINKEQGKIVVTLDIYGQVDSGYQSRLNDLLQENSDFVAYKGIVDSQKSVDTLKQYYALLFPTHWAGEGFPGTIIDAFAAGIPVIASDWNANKEIIQHLKQGVIYPNSEMHNLKDAINWSIQNAEKMADMRKDSRAEFEKYTSNAILQIIVAKMNEVR